MGHYNDDGKYVYSSMDVGNGVCSQEHYDKQRRDEQAKLDQNNAGEHSPGFIKDRNNEPK